MTYKFFEDASHGWLQIPRRELRGFVPSAFSYANATHVYLEEDCDLPRWLKHRGFDWKTLPMTRTYSDRSSVRNLRRGYYPHPEDKAPAQLRLV